MKVIGYTLFALVILLAFLLIIGFGIAVFRGRRGNNKEE